MATISNVNGKKITKIKYKGEIFDTGGASTDWLKEFLDKTKDASYLFVGYINYGKTPCGNYLTYEILQNALKYDTTSKVKNMSCMFYYCNQLITIPLINTSLVTDMFNMFTNCSNLTTIPQLDTSNVTNMSFMFNDCSKLTTIPQLNTSNVTNMERMFYGCYKLTTIDITHMNITLESNTNSFAYNCYSLTKLIIRNMPTIPILYLNSFNYCYHFTGTTDATYNPQGLKDGRIYVPDDKVEALKTATNWSKYADIIVPLSTLVE